jgi:hypothetical protein
MSVESDHEPPLRRHRGCDSTLLLQQSVNRREAVASRATAIDTDDVYELSPVEAADAIPDEWRSAATYTLEMAVRCPHCDESIRSIRIVGLIRSQVSFTSTLPRKGRVAICPECDRILPVELSSLM